MSKRTPDISLAPAVKQMVRLTEATLEGIFVHDAGLIVNVNRRAASLLGRPTRELNSCRVLDLVSEECRPMLRRQMDSFSNEPRTITVLRKDGSSFEVEITVKATLTCNGRRIQILALRDCRNGAFVTDQSIKRSRAEWRRNSRCGSAAA
jgi:PAS domain S-box-containing protein